VLLALSFPPISLSYLAFVALVPLFYYLDDGGAGRAVKGGILAGVVFFGITLSWLVSVARFSWLAIPAYLFIVIGLHVTNFLLFTIGISGLRRYVGLPLIATAPFLWVVCERLRGLGDLAFPWTSFGYALTRFPLLLQFADITGVYGVSFWLVLLNALLFAAIRARSGRNWRPYAACWLVLFGGVNLYNLARWYGKPAPAAGRVQVAIVQPNVAQVIKWDERYSREILRKMFVLNAEAEAASPHPDLVVWPETAIPYYIDESRPFRLTEMGPLTPGNTRVLSGLLLRSANAHADQGYYNAAALFDSSGNMLNRYKKLVLVPGAELYPFRRLLGFTRALFNIQDISYGAMDPGAEATVFSLPRGKFSVMICYESAFPQLAREFRRRGAQFLVNITNDAWFGHSFAAYQHASFLVMRAIENRVAIVRCGNTGISGFLDARGRWQQQSALETQAILQGSIPLTSGLTFYTRCGDLIVAISIAVVALFLVLALRKKLFTATLKEGR
jgi:apolipoprotein N-acyltransferase